MKTLFQLLLCTLLLTACKKETQTTNTAAANATVVRSGTLIQGSHKASGTVKITSEQGFRKLYFENFATDAGANVHIYLSKDATNSDFKDLGGLQAISGNQVYQVDNNTDLNLYKFVLIWNVPTSELYGYAELK
jgi:Electron transfer DM13